MLFQYQSSNIRAAVAMMPPMTTIPAPVQKSHQIGCGTIAAPPTVKPMMMTETATQEAGRPWCASCSCGRPVCASSPCAPWSPVASAMVPDDACSATPGSSPRERSYLFSGKCETDHQPAPEGTRPLTLPVWLRLGLVSLLAYHGMLGR